MLTAGVEAERIHVDHGLTGTNRERPGLREALAACWPVTPWWCPSEALAFEHEVGFLSAVEPKRSATSAVHHVRLAGQSSYGEQPSLDPMSCCELVCRESPLACCGGHANRYGQKDLRSGPQVAR